MKIDVSINGIIVLFELLKREELRTERVMKEYEENDYSVPYWSYCNAKQRNKDVRRITESLKIAMENNS